MTVEDTVGGGIANLECKGCFSLVSLFHYYFFLFNSLISFKQFFSASPINSFYHRSSKHLLSIYYLPLIDELLLSTNECQVRTRSIEKNWSICNEDKYLSS